MEKPRTEPITLLPGDTMRGEHAGRVRILQSMDNEQRATAFLAVVREFARLKALGLLKIKKDGTFSVCKRKSLPGAGTAL